MFPVSCRRQCFYKIIRNFQADGYYPCFRFVLHLPHNADEQITMIEIKDLLGRFKNILSSKEDEAESVRKIISEVIKVEIKSRDIQVKNGTVYLNIKPIYKNEILLRRNEIALRLKEVLRGKGSPNIR